MKRAEVWRNEPGNWGFIVWGGEIPDRGRPIILRDSPDGRIPPLGGTRETHEEALSEALEAVGLARPAEHREAP